MGMRSIVVINHDCLHLIENDPGFGERLAAACARSRAGGKNYDIGLSGAVVVGQEFHHSDVVIVVAEGGTAWTASWRGKPNWSKLTKSYAEQMLFGPPQPREKKVKQK
jgi:hypothetical protein